MDNGCSPQLQGKLCKDYPCVAGVRAGPASEFRKSSTSLSLAMLLTERLWALQSLLEVVEIRYNQKGRRKVRVARGFLASWPRHMQPSAYPERGGFGTS